jgi:hypothetical protein
MQDIIKDQAARIQNTHPVTGEPMVDVVTSDGRKGQMTKEKADAARKAGAIK